MGADVLLLLISQNKKINLQVRLYRKEMYLCIYCTSHLPDIAQLKIQVYQWFGPLRWLLS